MTFVIGIQARDNYTTRSYAAIAADTQWGGVEATQQLTTPQAVSVKKDDARKIVLPQGANYIFAFSGQPLNATYFALKNASPDDIKRFQEQNPARFIRILNLALAYNRIAQYEDLPDNLVPAHLQLERDLLKSSVLNPEKNAELFQQLKGGRSEAVIGINVYTDEQANSFLFAINDGKEREMYTVFPNGLSLKRGFTAFGSASPLALDVLVSHFGKDATIEPQLSPTDAIGILTEAIQRAQRAYDSGGADLAVITSQGVVSYRDNLDRLREGLEQEVKKFLLEQSTQIRL